MRTFWADAPGNIALPHKKIASTPCRQLLYHGTKSLQSTKLESTERKQFKCRILVNGANIQTIQGLSFETILTINIELKVENAEDSFLTVYCCVTLCVYSEFILDLMFFFRSEHNVVPSIKVHIPGWATWMRWLKVSSSMWTVDGGSKHFYM